MQHGQKSLVCILVVLVSNNYTLKGSPCFPSITARKSLGSPSKRAGSGVTERYTTSLRTQFANFRVCNYLSYATT